MRNHGNTINIIPFPPLTVHEPLPGFIVIHEANYSNNCTHGTISSRKKGGGVASQPTVYSSRGITRGFFTTHGPDETVCS